jgi:23S rRNA (pseudouridine1915-N3)-methyltransferase
MRVVVAAIGRLKEGPERALAAHYRKRAADAGRALGVREVEIVEVKESRARESGKRIIEESIALASLVPEQAAVVVLDEGGQNLSSLLLTNQLKRWRDEGRREVVFIVGGPDGMARTLHDRASLCLSFGAATWPHQLVRIMLLEQIYRSMTIWAGHPYHRE